LQIYTKITAHNYKWLVFGKTAVTVIKSCQEWNVHQCIHAITESSF